MSDARKAAEERYPYDYAREGDRLTAQQAFIEGAEWQAARTPQLTDEDVRKALVMFASTEWDIGPFAAMKSALEAALGQTNDTKEETA